MLYEAQSFSTRLYAQNEGAQRRVFPSARCACGCWVPAWVLALEWRDVFGRTREVMRALAQGFSAEAGIDDAQKQFEGMQSEMIETNYARTRCVLLGHHVALLLNHIARCRKTFIQVDIKEHLCRQCDKPRTKIEVLVGLLILTAGEDLEVCIRELQGSIRLSTALGRHAR